MASTTAFHALMLAMAALLLATSDASRATTITRLETEAGGGQTECWTALSNLRSCSNEIVGFLLNGQAEIDKPCCLAIATIAEHCWPALVGALGYSPEAVSFLQDYCEKTGSNTDPIDYSGSP